MTRKAVLFALLRGLAAGLCWTAGFYAAFPVWRYANLPGTVLLAAAVGGLLAPFFSLRGWEHRDLRLAAGVLSAAVLTPLIWCTSWFGAFLCALYRDFHVTEAGFAGLFTIIIYVFLSLLSLLLSTSLLTISRNRRAFRHQLANEEGRPAHG